MEALHIRPREEGEATAEEEEEEEEEREPAKRGQREEGGREASSPDQDEDEDEETDQEPSPVVRRKVSFADAFGLDLVSVKEFDNAEAKEPGVRRPPPEAEAARPPADVYVTCLFAVPSTPEELEQRLQAQMVELESIELLPGTTSIRGTVRVVNLCYGKAVHARVSLDRWQSCFDLPADYVPGSSDRRTDRFTFRYALAPPFEREGTRVEICLRYDTAAGTFWANNGGMNYVLFCHQRGRGGERGPRAPEGGGGSGGGGRRGKRSCLKASRSGSGEEKTGEASDAPPAAAHADASGEAAEADGGTRSPRRRDEQKPSVDGARGRRRAARRARAQDQLAPRGPRAPGARPRDPAGPPHGRQRRRCDEAPRVLTYHEIPLLTLDWNADGGRRRGAAEADDVWTGGTRAEAPAEGVAETPSVADAWEMFCNGTDDAAGGEISVCEAWRRFINGSGGEGHAGVPESEWLQTAASVSPSNDKGRTNTAAAAAGCLNAGAVDGISDGAGPQEGLSSGGEGRAAERFALTASERGEEEAALGRPARSRVESGGEDGASDDGGEGRATGAEAGIKMALDEEASDERSRPVRSSQNDEEEEEESKLEKMLLEGFVEDLLRGIWGEAFDRTAQASERDLDAVGGGADELADVPDGARGRPPSEKDLSDALESSALASAEDSSLECRGPERTSAAESGGPSPEERSPPVVHAEETHLAPESNHPRIRERSVGRVVAHRESFDPSHRQGHGPPASSPSPSSVWWGALYLLLHVTGLLTCALLVAAFLYVVFLCDFPAFFALYAFSLGWWFYKWRGHRAAADKAMAE